MAFCPKCKSEYKEGVQTCFDCKVELVDMLPVEYEDYVEIYACDNVLEAEHLKAILEDKSINCNLRVVESSPFPTSAGLGETRLVVLIKDQAKASDIITESIRNNEISDKGTFIGA